MMVPQTTMYSKHLLSVMAGGTMIFLFCVALFVPVGVHAQDISAIMEQEAASLNFDDLSASTVELDVSSSGAPGSTAIIRARTTNISDYTSLFDWYLDDQPMLLASGRARTEFSFQTTKPFHIVRVVVSAEGLRIAENTASVQSFVTSLSWATDTFVPAHYEGRALPSVGSRITVTAFPEIRGEAPENLLYTWYIDAESQVRNVLAEQEFSFVALKNAPFVSIMVEVSNLSQSVMISKAIVIPLVKPTLVFDPAFPVSFVPTGQRDINAWPYYFHIANTNNLSYRWSFGGEAIIGIPPNPQELTLVIPETSGSGSQYLTVTAENNTVLGETARNSLEIIVL